LLTNRLNPSCGSDAGLFQIQRVGTSSFSPGKRRGVGSFSAFCCSRPAQKPRNTVEAHSRWPLTLVFLKNLKEISEDLCGLQKSHAAILLSKFSISVQTDGQCMRARLSVSVL
jgi:hypothetical protein